MLTPSEFHSACAAAGIRFFTGVPDSLLKDFCAWALARLTAGSHIIAASEGGAVGLAAGHYLATGRPALVYMQNSGQGNAVNPLLSLADPEVYGLPMLLLVGWRGEPGVHDEPQHVKQGRVTRALFKAMEIPCEILSPEPAAAAAQVARLAALARREKRPVALLVRAGAFSKYPAPVSAGPGHVFTREEAIAAIVSRLPSRAVIVSTTGHISRELYEYRERSGSGHARDFLTVGSMGHASQIALGIALARPRRQVYCLDGDGALLMHMGALALIGSSCCANLRHIVLNNGAHGSVGGQPTAALAVSLTGIARACGYARALSANSPGGLKRSLPLLAAARGPAFLEVRVSGGARADLGRPAGSPAENKAAFIRFLDAGGRS